MKINIKKILVILIITAILTAALSGCGTTSGRSAADISLDNLDIIWLGSSVTYGAAARGYSMADAIQENHEGTVSHKFAKSGTTMVNESNTSYVSRMKGIDPALEADLFIVQLSTNDATRKKEMGSISKSKNPADFNDKTIIGAIETIIAYASETWDCPVVFYTGTYYESEEYAEMVSVLLQISEKWDIDVIDLWNNEEMTALYGREEYNSYMHDEIHPNREGYINWWTPVFEQRLKEILAARL